MVRIQFAQGHFLFRSFGIERRIHWFLLAVEQDDVRIIGEN